MNGTPGYFMDDPREPYRLGEKVDAEGWVETYVRPQLDDCLQVLDVGCGPGALAAAVARRAPDASVVALDLNDWCLAAARRQTVGLRNASVVGGSVLALPFPDASFDLVYSRFVLEYVPGCDRAVAEMARVCRPGGTVLLQDLDGQLISHYPPDDRLQADLTDVLSKLAELGFDPFVGRKLFHLAHRVGLTDLAVRSETYHLVAGRADEATMARWNLKLDIAMPALVEVVGVQRAERIRRDSLRYLARPDTITFSQLFTVRGLRPVSSGPVSRHSRVSRGRYGMNSGSSFDGVTAK